jgi:hypothetical protein
MVLGVLLIISCSLLLKSPTTGYIVLYHIYMTVSICIGLYPKLDSWNANKLQLQLLYLKRINFSYILLLQAVELDNMTTILYVCKSHFRENAD